jgi:chromosome segregation ATPase
MKRWAKKLSSEVKKMKTVTSIRVDAATHERAKASGMKMGYIFQMGLDAPDLRRQIKSLQERLDEQNHDLKKRADAILFLQSEILAKNDEIQALKDEIEKYKYPLSEKAKNKQNAPV